MKVVNKEICDLVKAYRKYDIGLENITNCHAELWAHYKNVENVLFGMDASVTVNFTEIFNANNISDEVEKITIDISVKNTYVFCVKCVLFKQIIGIFYKKKNKFDKVKYYRKLEDYIYGLQSVLDEMYDDLLVDALCQVSAS